MAGAEVVRIDPAALHWHVGCYVVPTPGAHGSPAGRRTGEMAMKGLIWILLGVAAGLMIAPRSGAGTRQEVMARINQVFGS